VLFVVWLLSGCCTFAVLLLVGFAVFTVFAVFVIFFVFVVFTLFTLFVPAAPQQGLGGKWAVGSGQW